MLTAQFWGAMVAVVLVAIYGAFNPTPPDISRKRRIIGGLVMTGILGTCITVFIVSMLPK